MRFLGFEIPGIFAKDDKEEHVERKEEENKLTSFTVGVDTEGAKTISADASGFSRYTVDFNARDASTYKNILNYRAATLVPECDNAISEIVDNTIVTGLTNQSYVKLNIEADDVDKKIAKKLQEEFTLICQLYKIKNNLYDMFRQWYIDGRIYFHIVVNPEEPEEGIQALTQLSPLNIKKIRETRRIKNKKTGVETVKIDREYFVYTDQNTRQVIEIHPDSVICVTSGLLLAGEDNEKEPIVISHLHKSLKIINQLQMMEDSLVVYRVARAPERRIFYVDTGNLPKAKSEEYVQGLMNRYKNKVIYDASTGRLTDETKAMGMFEDFWLPRREGGRGTEITTLPGADNLSQIEDVLFFQKKMYRSLNVPVRRLEAETEYNTGRGDSISREEVKFQRFIDRLRSKFAGVFIAALRAQAVLKKICTEEEWDNSIEPYIDIDFIRDNPFAELKDFEILKERADVLGTLDSYVGSYYSKEWIRTNVLKISDDEWKEIEKQIEAEGGDDDEEGGDDY